MSTDRDITRIVRSWLRTDEQESADRVLDAVLDRLDTTPQRRSTWWPARRLFEMNNTAKIVMTAAAVLVVAFLGFRFLGVGPNMGGPEPTPEPTPVPRIFSQGATLTPGNYLITQPFPVDITFAVPDGWYSWVSNASAAGMMVDNGSGGSGWGVTFWIVDNVYADPCDPDSLLQPSLGPSVDDLVAALNSLPGYAASDPVNISVSGFSGVQIELTAPEYGEECPTHVTWSATSSEPRSMQPGETNQVRILDVDGVRLVINSVEYAHTTEIEQAAGVPYEADAHAADQVELRQIMDSIRIESRP